MTKHTPGPWVACEVEYTSTAPTVFEVRDDDGEYVASVADEADADLIAAAPDLLAALEDIARGDYSDPLCMQTPEQRAREAIAKARGEQ